MSVSISIPSGYKILCNCNLAINGQSGVWGTFDGNNNINSNNPDIYIYNSSNGTRSGNVDIRIFTLFVKQ